MKLHRTKSPAMKKTAKMDEDPEEKECHSDFTDSAVVMMMRYKNIICL